MAADKLKARQRMVRRRRDPSYRKRELEYSRVYHANPINKKKKQKQYMRRRAVLIEQYPQPEACEVCGLRNQRSLHLDHNHSTGKVRGWLCANCNVAIGMASDNSNRLRALAAYLDSHMQGDPNGC